MRIAVDVHTHSVASGHAYSTVRELALGARRRGLAGFVLADHGPGLPGGTHPYHFSNLRILPERIEGVRFYRGIEANVMDLEGGLDLEPRWLAYLDFVLAGLHEICLAPRDAASNTRALVAALAHPLVDAISHPGNPAYPIDPEALVEAARERGKALEINAGSFRVRKGSEAGCATIARLCAERGTRVVVGSDAHWWRDVGRFDGALAILRAVRMPRELVVNASRASFDAFLAERALARGDRKPVPTA